MMSVSLSIIFLYILLTLCYLRPKQQTELRYGKQKY
nr:MAG TPA: hypothetical protein [Caudoviricetes sp.]